jgi:hypothetical protein
LVHLHCVPGAHGVAYTHEKDMEMITFCGNTKHPNGAIYEYFSITKFLTALESVIHPEMDGFELNILIFPN